MLPDNTSVTMVNGVRKPIEFIRPGDEVITTEGGKSTVYYRAARLYTGMMVQVSVDNGFRGLLMTPDQKIYVFGRGFVLAEELLDGMALREEAWWGNIPSTQPALVAIHDLDTVDVKELPVYEIEVRGSQSYFANGLAVGDQMRPK